MSMPDVESVPVPVDKMDKEQFLISIHTLADRLGDKLDESSLTHGHVLTVKEHASRRVLKPVYRLQYEELKEMIRRMQQPNELKGGVGDGQNPFGKLLPPRGGTQPTNHKPQQENDVSTERPEGEPLDPIDSAAAPPGPEPENLAGGEKNEPEDVPVDDPGGKPPEDNAYLEGRIKAQVAANNELRTKLEAATTKVEEAELAQKLAEKHAEELQEQLAALQQAAPAQPPPALPEDFAHDCTALGIPDPANWREWVTTQLKERGDFANEIARVTGIANPKPGNLASHVATLTTRKAELEADVARLTPQAAQVEALRKERDEAVKKAEALVDAGQQRDDFERRLATKEGELTQKVAELAQAQPLAQEKDRKIQDLRRALGRTRRWGYPILGVLLVATVVFFSLWAGATQSTTSTPTSPQESEYKVFVPTP